MRAYEVYAAYQGGSGPIVRGVSPDPNNEQLTVIEIRTSFIDRSSIEDDIIFNSGDDRSSLNGKAVWQYLYHTRDKLYIVQGLSDDIDDILAMLIAYDSLILIGELKDGDFKDSFRDIMANYWRNMASGIS